MKAIVAYVRSLLSWTEDGPTFRPSFKRDRRNDDDISSDDDSPALKRYRLLNKTTFPDSMTTKDIWAKGDGNKKVRHVPIQVEKGHPSTSTPNELPTRLANRIRLEPDKVVDLTESGDSTPTRKPRMHTPQRPVILTVVDNNDDDDDNEEVTFVAKKPANIKKPCKACNHVEDEDDGKNTDDEVIFVKKMVSPPPVKPFKFFVSKNKTNEESPVQETNEYFNLCKKMNDRNSSVGSPRCNKFKAPAGVTKAYRRPSPIPKWIQSQKSSNLSPNRTKCVNGNARSTLTQVFNLDEKKNYQELIKRVANCLKSTSSKKPSIQELAADAAMFRNTQKAQKSSLNDLILVEKDINKDAENESTTEYDPITVASINSSDSEVEIVPSETSTSSSMRIDRINTLRDSLKGNPVTSGDWLKNLNSRYSKRVEDNKVKLKDATRESDIISKVIYKQNIALIEHKLKHELSIPESLIEETPPTPELPKLTPEQESLVDRALNQGPGGQLLVEKFNLRIHRRDLQTLAKLNWLNDEVINFYMNLLMQRSEARKDLPRVYAANTFFYPKLMQSGQAGLRRWTRKVDIFAHDLMVVPVHMGVHWCLSLVHFGARRIEYLDSMGGRNQPCLDALLQYLRDEHKDKKGELLDDADWTTINLKDIPQQMNGSDCGMFACTFAEFASRNAPYTFTQANMPALRRKVAYEILTAKLML